MRRAVRVHLTEAEARQLRAWSAAPGGSGKRSRRAKIVLLAAEGWTNQAIATKLKVHPETVALWRRRFVSNRLEGVRMDAPRSGHGARSARLTARILSAAARDAGGEGRGWTTRTLAKRLGVSHMTVYRTWHAYQMDPPQMSASARAQGAHAVPADPVSIEGVFLHPPRRAAVFQVDGHGRIPSWEELWNSSPPARDARTRSSVDLRALFHQWERSSVSHSTATGSVAELLVFLRMVEERAPAGSSFMVLYKGFSREAEKRVARWVQSHRRFHPVRVPVGSTWFSAVERCLRCGPPDPPTPRAADVLGPLAESLASYLRTNPAAPAPFVWATPSLGGGPTGPSGPL